MLGELRGRGRGCRGELRGRGCRGELRGRGCRGELRGRGCRGYIGELSGIGGRGC